MFTQGKIGKIFKMYVRYGRVKTCCYNCLS